MNASIVQMSGIRKQSFNAGFFYRTMLLLLCLLVVNNMFGSTLTVGPAATGATYTTIELAYNAAVDGDVIQVLPTTGGVTYDEDIIKFPSDVLHIRKSITIDGGGNTIVNNGTGVGAFEFTGTTTAGNTVNSVLQNINLCSFNRTGGLGATIFVGHNFAGIPDYYEPQLVTFNNVNVMGAQSNTYAVRFESRVIWNGGSISNNSNIGLYIYNIERPEFTVTFNNARLECNPGSGPEFGGAIAMFSDDTGNAVNLSFNGGSISNNGTASFSYHATAIYAYVGGASNIDISGTTFAGNIDNSTTGNVGIIHISDSWPGTTPQFTITNSIFDGNICDDNLVTSTQGGTITNSLIRNNTLTDFAGGATYTNNIFEANSIATPNAAANTTVGGAGAATNTTTTFNYPGIILSACVAGCTPASGVGAGATISYTCTGENSTLTSTSTGQWYYQQGTTVTAIAGATGTTATIPTGLVNEYAIFFQDVPTVNGTDPIIGFTVTAAVVVAAAGADQNVTLGSPATLAANNTTGVWSIVSGPNTSLSQFGNVNVYNTTFTPTNSGNYVLRWTVGTTPCITTDDVALSVAAPTYFISGTLFNDPNGLANSLVDGTGIGTASAIQMYANLVQGGSVVQSVTLPVSTGIYNFTGLSAGSYTVVIATSASATSPSVPGGWVNVGEAFGTNNGAGTGNEGGTPNGSIAVTVGSSNVTGVNFGIERPPVANVVNAAAQPNPGGTTQVTVPTLKGSDLEDGSYTGTGLTDDLIIQTIPNAGTQGILYYNNIAVTAGQTITNYNPALLTVDPVNGSVTVSFTYSEVDAAGVASAPATVSMPFGTATCNPNQGTWNY